MRIRIGRSIEGIYHCRRNSASMGLIQPSLHSWKPLQSDRSRERSSFSMADASSGLGWSRLLSVAEEAAGWLKCTGTGRFPSPRGASDTAGLPFDASALAVGACTPTDGTSLGAGSPRGPRWLSALAVWRLTRRRDKERISPRTIVVNAPRPLSLRASHCPPWRAEDAIEARPAASRARGCGSSGEPSWQRIFCSLQAMQAW